MACPAGQVAYRAVNRDLLQVELAALVLRLNDARAAVTHPRLARLPASDGEAIVEVLVLIEFQYADVVIDHIRA